MTRQGLTSGARFLFDGNRIDPTATPADVHFLFLRLCHYTCSSQTVGHGRERSDRSHDGTDRWPMLICTSDGAEEREMIQ